MLRYAIGIFFLLWLPLTGFAKEVPPVFEEGQAYEVLSQAKPMPYTQLAQGKVEVTEFFSYGCPWCYRLEPNLLDWSKKNNKKIKFQRVPVIFEQNWEIFARAYYLAHAFKLDEKFSLDLFSAIQSQKLQTMEDLKKFFVSHGIKPKVFDEAYISPVIDSDMLVGKKLMAQYGIDRVPTIVVAGKFKTDIGRVNGDNAQFIQLINMLVNKAITDKVASGQKPEKK